MTDLVARLRAALDEAERIASAATPGPWRWGDWSATFGTLEQDPYVLERAPGIGPFPAVRQRDEECDEVLRTEVDDFGEGNRAYIAHHDPTRELRMIAAHRKILDACTTVREWVGDHQWMANAMDEALAALAEAHGVKA